MANFYRIGIICIFCHVLSISLKSQDFYDINKIQEVKLYFSQTNWRSLLNTAASSTAEPYTLAKKVIINGVSFDSVGAKFKGNSTFSTNRIKNPFHIELDYVKDQNYQGYQDIKLANVFADPSFVREALSYELMQFYTDLPRANFAKVWVNDTLIGLYTNTEAVTKRFCKNHFYSSENNVFIKCTPPRLQMGGTNSSLSYLGTDSTKYYAGYEMSSAFGWKELIHLCDTLVNKTSEVEKILDVDRALWMLAFNVLFLNFDSYTGSFTQNWYLWRDDNRLFNSIIWDLNMSFGGFNVGGGGGGGTDSLSAARTTIFSGETNANKPLIMKLLANQRYRKMFIAHIRTMADELFRSKYYISRGDSMRLLIDPAVLEDPNKLSTYAQFKTNFYYNTTGGGGIGGGNTLGVVSLMTNRLKYLDTLKVYNAIHPIISNVNSKFKTKLNDTVWINATVTGHNSDGVLMGYRLKKTDYFTKIVMYDDGNHQDDAANDGIYGAGVRLKSPTMEYYIWAENSNAGIFSPVRAEHEFHTVRAHIPLGDLVINELMASNTNTIADPDGEFDDWIELYNNANSAIDISGWFISDNSDNLDKWKFPEGTNIPGDGYLIIWADEDSSQNNSLNYHNNFKLSSSGEAIYLSASDHTLVDEVQFGQLNADISYARSPNGKGDFVRQKATFAKNNDLINSIVKLSNENLEVFPNPMIRNKVLTILIDNNAEKLLTIHDSFGHNILQQKIQNSASIDLSQLNSGLYFVSVGNRIKKLIIQ